jgi:5-methylcytosine-specific restriction endonuclease McrA
MVRWIRPNTRKAIYARDRFKCVYCGSKRYLSLDHVLPRSRGGDNTPGNLVTACLTCNDERGDKSLLEWCYSLPMTYTILFRVDRQLARPIQRKAA